MKSLTLILSTLISFCSQAQPIFSFGNHQVSKQEFLDAYYKNGNTNSSIADYREYLNLFTRYKLKVQAAYDMKVDTVSSQKRELTEYKVQLVDSYSGTDSITNQLVQEEFLRSQKDIDLGLIYIPVSAGSTADSFAAAAKTIRQAYAELKAGSSFESVASKYSRDPAVSMNSGHVGYITAFVLPYAIESIIYSTPKGAYAAPFQLKSGWLIVKNMNERPAVGRVQVSQILIGYPREGNGPERAEAKKLVDSLYTALHNGADFNTLATAYSHDLFSYQQGGVLPAFGTGTYDASFEQQAFALNNQGELSKPFETLNGFHILRLDRKIPVPSTLDSTARQEIMQLIVGGDRLEWIQQRTTENLKLKTGFKALPVDMAKLDRHTAYITEHPRTNTGILSNTQQLFTVNGRRLTISEYNRFLKELAAKDDLNGELYQRFVLQSIKEQYAKKLAAGNGDYRKQVADFKDANLLFAVMQQKVWNAATSDNNALQAFYEKHKSNYKWEASAEALILTAADETIAEAFKKELQKAPEQWRQLVDNMPGMQADSGRFELGQIPVADRTAFSEKLITSNQRVENMPTVSFGYIIKLYPAGETKAFADSMGQVISDYQSFLEEKWITELKQKYPVKINEEVVRSLATH